MCSMKDEGGPLETGVEARASNRHELLRHNGCGGERQWKSRNNEFGRCDAWRRAKANRPMTYREDFTRCQNQGRLRVLGIRTAEASLLAVRHPRGAVKTGHPGAVENRPPLGGQFPKSSTHYGVRKPGSCTSRVVPPNRHHDKYLERERTRQNHWVAADGLECTPHCPRDRAST